MQVVQPEVEETTRAKVTFVIKTRFNILRMAISAKFLAEARPSMVDISRVHQVYKEYQREALPEFKGGITEYAAFKKEWKECVTPGRYESWQLIQLQKRNQEECNISRSAISLSRIETHTPWFEKEGEGTKLEDVLSSKRSVLTKNGEDRSGLLTGYLAAKI